MTAFGASVAEEAVRPSPPQVDGKSAAQLTELLHHDQFAVREAASNGLVEQTRDALESLAVSIQSDDPEAAYRSVAILTRFLDSTDSELAHEAQELLRLGGRKARPGSIVATAFLREARRREPEATKKLTELGASIRKEGSSLTLLTTWKGGNEGLVHLRWLPKLKSAELRHSKIDNAGLLYLRGLAQLESLNLNRTKITSQGLASLTQLPKLKTLLLQRTHVDDNAIEHLRNLKQLRAVNLLGTKFTKHGIEKLRAAMPEITVLY